MACRELTPGFVKQVRRGILPTSALDVLMPERCTAEGIVEHLRNLYPEENKQSKVNELRAWLDDPSKCVPGALILDGSTRYVAAMTSRSPPDFVSCRFWVQKDWDQFVQDDEEQVSHSIAQVCLDGLCLIEQDVPLMTRLVNSTDVRVRQLVALQHSAVAYVHGPGVWTADKAKKVDLGVPDVVLTSRLFCEITGDCDGENVAEVRAVLF